MKKYFGIALLSFKTNLSYRIDSLASLANAIVWTLVATTLWRKLYGPSSIRDGISADAALTYICIVTVMNLAYTMDESFIERRVRRGTIACEFAKPMSFGIFVFAYMAGTAAFRFVFLGIPALLFGALLFRMQPPPSALALGLCLISSCLGFAILFLTNLLVWVSSFWFHVTWSFITIKEAILSLLAGVVVPLWFMPSWLRSAVAATPIFGIYHAPTTIYTGVASTGQALTMLVQQAAWTVVLLLAARIALGSAARKLHVQGG